MKTYAGECIACHKHVENGHGWFMNLTLCPDCCKKGGGCTCCTQSVRDELSKMLGKDFGPIDGEIPKEPLRHLFTP